MSDVETDDEDGSIVYRTLPWRGENLNNLIKLIDDALKAKRTYSNVHSSRSFKPKTALEVISPDYL